MQEQLEARNAALEAKIDALETENRERASAAAVEAEGQRLILAQLDALETGEAARRRKAENAFRLWAAALTAEQERRAEAEGQLRRAQEQLRLAQQQLRLGDGEALFGLTTYFDRLGLDLDGEIRARAQREERRRKDEQRLRDRKRVLDSLPEGSSPAPQRPAARPAVSRAAPSPSAVTTPPDLGLAGAAGGADGAGAGLGGAGGGLVGGANASSPSEDRDGAVDVGAVGGGGDAGAPLDTECMAGAGAEATAGAAGVAAANFVDDGGDVGEGGGGGDDDDDDDDAGDDDDDDDDDEGADDDDDDGGDDAGDATMSESVTPSRRSTRRRSAPSPAAAAAAPTARRAPARTASGRRFAAARKPKPLRVNMKGRRAPVKKRPAAVAVLSDSDSGEHAEPERKSRYPVRGSTRWRAQLKHNRKLEQIGYFDTEEEAARAVAKFLWANGRGGRGQLHKGRRSPSAAEERRLPLAIPRRRLQRSDRQVDGAHQEPEDQGAGVHRLQLQDRGGGGRRVQRESEGVRQKDERRFGV